MLKVYSNKGFKMYTVIGSHIGHNIEHIETDGTPYEL